VGLVVRQLFVTFSVGEHFLGLDVTLVREINRFLDITPVQHAPQHVRGLINLRGQLVTVFDLGVWLGFGPRTITAVSHNVILKQEPIGLLVDEIGEVVEAESRDIEAPPANAVGIRGECLAGVVQLADRLLSVLSVDGMLTESSSGEN